LEKSAVTATDLVRLLDSVGKDVFVRYYEGFRDPTIHGRAMVSRLPSKYTLKSRISRTSKARRIFREHLEQEALRMIAASEKVSSVCRDKARKLLSGSS
jgi:hypothetical protein